MILSLWFFACADDSNPEQTGGNTHDAGAGGAGGSAAGGAASGGGGAGEGGAAPPAPPAMPEVVSLGGPVIASPKVVPIFFAGDPLQPQLEQFLAQLATSSYWSATTAEYGVGALTIAPAIVVPDPAPDTVTDDEIKSWLAAQADGSHEGWPKADPDTVFTVVYPATTSIDVHGKKSCQAFDAYHLEGTDAEGEPLIYAVLSRCVSGAAALDEVTGAMSHELVEAATDPRYVTAPAFAQTDADHFIWTITTAGEVSDLCAFDPQSYAPLVGDFVAQRSWSNAAAAAGEDPCVPAIDEPFFDAAPVLLEDVTLHAGSSVIATKGVVVPVGESRTIDVVLFGDPGAEPWTLEAADGSSLFGGAKELELAWDTPSGKSGDVRRLTVHAVKPGSFFGGSLLVVRSKRGDVERSYFGFIANDP